MDGFPGCAVRQENKCLRKRARASSDDHDDDGDDDHDAHMDAAELGLAPETAKYFRRLVGVAREIFARKYADLDIANIEVAQQRRIALTEACQVVPRSAEVHHAFKPISRHGLARFFRCVAHKPAPTPVTEEVGKKITRARIVRGRAEVRAFEPNDDLFVIILREVWDTEGVVEQWARYAKQKFEATMTFGIINEITETGEPYDGDEATMKIKNSKRRHVAVDNDAAGKKKIRELIQELKTLGCIAPNFKPSSSAGGSSVLISSQSGCERQFIHADYSGEGAQEPAKGDAMSMLIALGVNCIFHACEACRFGDYDITSTFRLSKGDIVLFADDAYHAGGEYVGEDNIRLHAYLARNTKPPRRVKPQNKVFPAPNKIVEMYDLSNEHHRNVQFR